MRKKILSSILALAICISSVSPVLAANDESYTDLAEKAASRYVSDVADFIKISHYDVNASNGSENYADGLLDYLGGGKLGIPGKTSGEMNNVGDRGQSYAWASVGYGDWFYVSTLYNSMMTTLNMMGDTGLSGFDKDQLNALIDMLYCGTFFHGEPDEGNPGSTLCKINVKTGEVEVLMSKDKNDLNAQFRYGMEFNGKLYFCGSVNFVPSIYEVDPATDEFRCVYRDKSVLTEDGRLDPNALYEIKEKGLSVAIRGMTSFDDHLVISCVGLDGNPYIAISDNPSDPDSYTVIAYAWADEAQTKPGELLGYPACHMEDSIYGGSIWEMVEFNNDLYVAMCTGTPDNSPDGGKTMQSFALMRGECSGDPAQRSSWTWTPVIGNPNDGAKYTFGIDPERTRSGACCMMIYQDHLYIGEYNDMEIGMKNFLAGFDLGFMADNLEQSVSLYRMDKDENIELVMGTPTELFPASLSGLASGFGSRENQYIWKMNVFSGKLYVGTYDQTSLTEPIAQLSNGDLIGRTPEQWQAQLKYIIEFIRSLLKESEQVSLEAESVEGNALMMQQQTLEIVPDVEAASSSVPTESEEQEPVLSEAADAEGTVPGSDSSVSGEVPESAEPVPEPVPQAGESLPEAALPAPEPVPAPEKDVISDLLTEEDAARIPELAEALNEDDLALLNEIVEADADFLETFGAADALNLDELPEMLSEHTEIHSAAEMHQMLLLLTAYLDQSDDMPITEKIQLKLDFAEIFKALYEYLHNSGIKIPDFIKDLYEQILEHTILGKVESASRCLLYLRDSVRGFDLYVTENGKDFTCITRDGMGDPFNQGLRAFAANNSEDNPWMCIGTANPFYGTQLWRMEGEGLNLPPAGGEGGNEGGGAPDPEIPPVTPDPDDNKPAPEEKPEPEDKPAPESKPAPTPAPTAPAVSATSAPKTGDESHLALWALLGTVSLAGAVGLTVYRKKNHSR